MLPITLSLIAAAAAEKTAETSYAIYLWCVGGVVAAGGVTYVAAPTVKEYLFRDAISAPDNALEEGLAVISPENAITHQDELRENAGLLCHQLIQTNEVIASRRLAQQGIVDEGIQTLIQSANHCLETTAQLKDTVKRLQDDLTTAERRSDAQQSEMHRILGTLSIVVNELNQSQAHLAALEQQLKDPVHQLTLSSAQLTAQLLDASQSIQRLQSLHQDVHGIMHEVDTIQLQQQIQQLSLTNASLTTSLRLAMQHRHPQEEFAMPCSPDAIAVGYRSPFFR